MKKCLKCNKEFDDKNIVCPVCNEKLTNTNKKTISIEDDLIKKKMDIEEKNNRINKYYHFGIIIIVILAFISYQVDFLIGILLFPTLGLMLYSKAKNDDDTKVKPLEVILTMPIVFIILIIIGIVLIFTSFFFFLPL